MNIQVEKAQARVAVAILQIDGDVNGSNFKDLIAFARELVSAGTRAILLDLTQVRYVSSAGLLAIQTIAALLHGNGLPDPEAGWQALHRMESAAETMKAPNLKLLNPQPHVERALDMVGFTQFLDVYTDRDKALSAF